MGPELLRQAQRLAPAMSPKQVTVIDNMLRMGDEAGAAQYMQYIEAALRTDDYVPRGPPGVRVGSTALSVPGSREVIPYTPGKPQVRVAPRQTQAGEAGGSTWQAPGNDLIRRLAEAGGYGGGAIATGFTEWVRHSASDLSREGRGAVLPAGRAGAVTHPPATSRGNLNVFRRVPSAFAIQGF
jgi:hypothetical protein